MKYLILSILLFVAGVTLAFVERQEQIFTPIVRVRSADGLYITLVQPRTLRRSACNAMVEGFKKALDGACPTCAVESSDCATKLEGIDRALADGERLPIYTVAAEGMRIGVVGPPHVVRVACEGMAVQFVANGAKTASCVEPAVRKN
jgi:hypothetical protein